MQSLLAANTQGQRKRRRRGTLSVPLLADLLYSADGARFVPTHAIKGARRYQYYTENRPAGDKPRRLPAAGIENAVVAGLVDYLRDPRQLAVDLTEDHFQLETALGKAQSLAGDLVGPAKHEARQNAKQIMARVVYRDTHLELHINKSRLQSALGRESASLDWPSNRQESDDLLVLRTPLAIRHRGQQLKLTVGNSHHTPPTPDRTLVTAIVRAYDWAARIAAGASVTEVSKQEGITDSQVSRHLPLAFLAPSMAERILAGYQPGDVIAHRLINKATLPLSWPEQLRLLG